MLLKKMKSELKEMAANIRASRRESRDIESKFSHWQNAHPKCHEYGSSERKEMWAFSTEQHKTRKFPWVASPAEFREKHIIYCLLRGRTYEQIEPKVRQGNEPRWDRIDKALEVARQQLDKERAEYEALRRSAV